MTKFKSNWLHKIILITFGLVIGYGMGQIQLNKNKLVTSKIINNCMNVFSDSNDLIANYQKAFNSLASCTVLYPSYCDHQKTANELNQLKTERTQIESKLKSSSDETLSIIEMAK